MTSKCVLFSFSEGTHSWCVWRRCTCVNNVNGQNGGPGWTPRLTLHGHVSERLEFYWKVVTLEIPQTMLTNNIKMNKTERDFLHLSFFLFCHGFDKGSIFSKKNAYFLCPPESRMTTLVVFSFYIERIPPSIYIRIDIHQYNTQTHTII